MIHITDFNGNIIDFISHSDGAVTEADHMINVEDKLETFDFTILTSRTGNLQTRNRILITDKDGQYREFIIYNISSDLNGYTRVQTNASALEDIKTAKPVAPHKLDKHTVKQALEYALADTGWKVSDEAEWGGTRTTSWTGWHDRISILKQLETTYDMRLSFHVEVGSNKITNRYVSLNKVEPLFKGEEIVYGDNMIDLKRTVDFSDIATALICLGPEDSETGKREIVEVKDDDAQTQFGLPYRYIWDIYEPQSSDEKMTRKRLTTLGRTALNKRKQASISYDIDGIGLSASAGDMIRVKNEDFTPELYVDAEVVEVTTDLISGESQYKFGVIKEYTRDDVYARFNAMLSGLRERLNKVVENTDSIISERLEEELKYVERYIEKSPTPPLNAKEGQLWLDTSHDGVAVLKRYENGQWVKSTPDNVKDIGGMTREETMYETLKLRFNRNEINFNEAFNRYDTLSKDKYYEHVDQALKQQLSSAINRLSGTFNDFRDSFNAINSERPTIGLITTAIDRALKYEQALKQYEAIYLKARESYDEYIRVLQSQYSDEKFNEAMQEVASAIGGTFDGTNIIADIPNQEDLKALNESIKQYLNGELSTLDGKLGKQIETVVNQAKDEFSVAIESVEKKVDGIAIGGRNLITGTSDKFKSVTFNGWTGGFSENVYVGGENTLQPNDEVVASVYVKSGEQRTAILVNEYIDSTRVKQVRGNYIPANAEGYSVIKFKISEGVTRLLLHLRHDAGDTPSDTKQYKELMLVKGNQTRDWTPAPEDYDNKINNLTQEVSKNTTSLNVLENEISLKADSDTVKQILDSELKAVKSNVATNQSELKLLSNQIGSKVEKSEYTTDMNGITRDIRNAKSEINQLSDSVNSKITSVEQKFDDLEIGGTNLLRNSNNFSTNTWTSYDNSPLNITENVSVDEWGATDATQVYVGAGDRTSTLKAYQQITNSTNTVEGETYTVSFYVKNIRDVPMSVNVNGITAPPVDIEPNESKRVVFTGTRTSNHLQLQFRSYGVNFYTEFIVWRAKVEKSNKVSYWSPAPEDYQSQIDKQDNILTKHETEIEQNKLGLNTKVSYTEMNGTNKTLEKLLTEFSQTSTGFNFRIDSNGMIQDLTFDRNRFKLNSNLIEFNDGDVVIKDGVTTIKQAVINNGHITELSFDKLKGGTARFGGKDHNGSFEVYDIEDNPIMKVDYEQAVASELSLGTLNVEQIESKSVVTVMQNARVYEVDATKYADLDEAINLDDEVDSTILDDEVDSTTSETWVANSIQQAIDSIPKYINDNVLINVRTQTNDDIVFISGFHGRGEMRVQYHIARNGNGFKIVSNSVRVDVWGGGDAKNYNTGLFPNNAREVIEYRQNKYSILRNLHLHGDGNTGDGLRVWQGSSVVIRLSRFYNVNIGIYVSENSTVTALETEGMAERYGWYVNWGSRIFGSGDLRPNGKTSPYIGSNGSRDFTQYNSQPRNITNPPKQNVTKTTTKRWTTSSARVFYRNQPNNWTVSFMRDFAIQGRWDGYGFRDGAWFFGSAMRNELRGKTIKRIRVSIGRSAHSSQGFTGKRTFSLRLHNRSNKPASNNNTNPTFSSQVFRGSLAMGERKWFDVTSTFRTTLSSGTWYGFGVKTDSNNRAEYMAMMKSLTVEVTYE